MQNKFGIVQIKLDREVGHNAFDKHRLPRQTESAEILPQRGHKCLRAMTTSHALCSMLDMTLSSGHPVQPLPLLSRARITATYHAQEVKRPCIVLAHLDIQVFASPQKFANFTVVQSSRLLEHACDRLCGQ